MKKSIKIWLIIATVLVLIGIVISFISLGLLNFDFRKLDTHEYERNTYNINQSFENILIDSYESDIKFLPSKDETPRIECVEEDNLKYSVTVEENTLKISVSDNRKWTDYIGISTWNTDMLIYLPHSSYKNLSIKTNTGDVEIPSYLEFENVKIKGTTADVELSAKVANDIEITATTGEVTIENTKSKNLKINVDTGDIELDNFDAENISITTTTGDIEGRLLSEKIFITETSTGDIDVPQSKKGGICELKTTTGDIEIEIY